MFILLPNLHNCGCHPATLRLNTQYIWGKKSKIIFKKFKCAFF